MSVERVSYEIMQDLRTVIARVSKLKLQCKVFPCINLPVESNVTSPFDKSFHCIAYNVLTVFALHSHNQPVLSCWKLTCSSVTTHAHCEVIICIPAISRTVLSSYQLADYMFTQKNSVPLYFQSSDLEILQTIGLISGTLQEIFQQKFPA